MNVLVKLSLAKHLGSINRAHHTKRMHVHTRKTWIHTYMHAYIHTLFRGGHYDSWQGIMTDAIPILKSLLTESPPSPGKVGHTPGSTSPTLFKQRWGFCYIPKEPDKWKCWETGPTAFCSYPRILEAALSSQLFKDPEGWSGQGLNPRPPAQQTGTFPTELTRHLHSCKCDTCNIF